MSDDIVSKPIRDNNGNLIGNITGRREEIERFNNSDLREQIKSDERKDREEAQRRRR